MEHKWWHGVSWRDKDGIDHAWQFKTAKRARLFVRALEKSGYNGIVLWIDGKIVSLGINKV
mgnify:CR=1 FL=1